MAVTDYCFTGSIHINLVDFFVKKVWLPFMTLNHRFSILICRFDKYIYMICNLTPDLLPAKINTDLQKLNHITVDIVEECAFSHRPWQGWRGGGLCWKHQPVVNHSDETPEIVQSSLACLFTRASFFMLFQLIKTVYSYCDWHEGYFQYV